VVMITWDIYEGNCIDVMNGMEAGAVHCCVTSPPYWGLRDYGSDGQIGLEETPEEYVDKMVEVFRAVRRVLRDDGTLWLNLGDSYATSGGAVGRCPGGGEQGERFLRQGHINTQPNRMPIPGLKPKDLVGIPWRVAFALQVDGWYLRSDIIWAKSNPMPESVRDRPTKSHEHIFLLTKQKKYYYDHEAIKEEAVGGHTGSAASFKRKNSKREQAIPGQSMGTHRPNRADVAYNGSKRNKRDVWFVATQPYKGAHFAVFPQKLIEPCVLAGCPKGGTVFDPFCGAGTTGLVALDHGRNFIGIELNPEYADLAQKRIEDDRP